MKSRWGLWRTGVYLLLVLFWAICGPSLPSAVGCPGCKEALFDPEQLPQRLATAKGYALSILLMLAVPVALVGGICSLVVRAQRNKN